MEKKIASIKKQNEGIETSLQSRGISFNKMSVSIDDLDKELLVLTNYNEYLKQVVKDSKPKVEKIDKPPIPPTIECEEPDYIEEKIVYKPNCSLEDVKRAFFSKDYETFETQIGEFTKQNYLKFYKVNYRYANEKDGVAEYIAKNQVRGFIQMLDQYRRFLLVCFRCIQLDAEAKTYRYPSYWIVSADTDIKTLLGSIYDDFDFIVLEDEAQVSKMLHKMRKNEDESDTQLVSEMYLN